MSRTNKPGLTPACTSGHLYYVRLKTEFGIFYKLGFTSMASVEQRLSYKGSGDEKYIDKILLFSFYADGYHIEQKLHSHFYWRKTFGKYSNKSYMPLCSNGQTELYTHDILNLDPQFTENQERVTKRTISNTYNKRRGNSDRLIQAVNLLELIFKPLFTYLVIPIIVTPFVIIGKVADLLFKEDPKEVIEREEKNHQDQKRDKEIRDLIENIRKRAQLEVNQKPE